jgi:diguanylate cyclase (GGDEF)-like protein/PAS domain S-box-containing protein
MSPGGGDSVPPGEAYAQAILDAALDAVITIDHLGRVLEFNRAAERTFGYRKQDILGLELAELIVPPELRAAHRAAIARWTEHGSTAGRGSMLDRRIDVDAMRSDGSIFPAEVAISRVDIAGPPIFTACLRDITERREAEDRLQRAEFQYRTLVEQLPLISYVDSPESPVSKPLYLSPQVEAVHGVTVDEWLSTPNVYESLIHDDDRERVLAEKKAAYDHDAALRLEYRMLGADGRTIWVEDQSVLVEPPEGGRPFRQGFVVDITDRKHAEDALRRAEVRYRTLVEQLPLAIYVDRIDESSSNVYTSPQIELLLGYSPEEWVSDPGLFVELLHPDDRERVLASHARTYSTGEPLCVEYRLIAKDGRVVWIHDEALVIPGEDGDTPFLQGYLLDTTARVEAEAELRHQALHDGLTGLANRALFADRVQHALIVGSNAPEDAAVIMLDLDDFNAVNDSLGFSAGDVLLQAVGVRLQTVLSPRHTIARMGGDEFAILVEGPAALSAALDAAELLVAEFQAPLGVDGQDVFVSASMGIALGQDADELLRSADVALSNAKASGGARYVVYAPRMDKSIVGRLALIADLRRAYVEEDFELHYQPIVELATGRLVGVEALVRWQHPRLGLLQPVDFISLAEDTGRIVEIGRWVLAEACRQTAEWKLRLPRGTPLEVSVNVSTRQVRRPGLLEDVRGALVHSRLEPAALRLEITESVLAGPREELIDALEEVTRLGVAIALDDFGTGYSSLSLLQDLPVETVKMDRLFVRTIGMGREQTAFARAIIDLSRALGLEVVAEGIENAAQVAVLRHLGCRFGQGYHFAKPLEPHELDELMSSGNVPRLPSVRQQPVKVA